MEVIRHVAASWAGDRFLTAEFERRVRLWSFADRAMLAEFDTVLDFGGDRLALCGSDVPIVVAGAWARHGVCAYDQDGTRIWQRKDLKKVQQLSPALGGALVAACFGDGPMQLLGAETGESVASVRGIRGFADAPSSTFGIGDDVDDVLAIDTSGDWQVRWRAKVGGLGVLARAVGPQAIAVATGGGFGTHDRSMSWVVALSPDGDELWRWACQPDVNCLALAWDDTASEWVGILNTVAEKRSSTLARWSPDGELLSTRRLGSFSAHGFLAGGRYLVTSDGTVRESNTGEVVWDFRTPST